MRKRYIVTIGTAVVLGASFIGCRDDLHRFDVQVREMFGTRDKTGRGTGGGGTTTLSSAFVGASGQGSESGTSPIITLSNSQNAQFRALLGGSPLNSAKFNLVVDLNAGSGTTLVIDPQKQASPGLFSASHFSLIDAPLKPRPVIRNQVNWSMSSILAEQLSQFGPTLPEYEDTAIDQFCDFVSLVSFSRDSYGVLVRYINGAKFAQVGPKLARSVLSFIFDFPDNLLQAATLGAKGARVPALVATFAAVEVPCTVSWLTYDKRGQIKATVSTADNTVLAFTGWEATAPFGGIVLRVEDSQEIAIVGYDLEVDVPAGVMKTTTLLEDTGLGIVDGLPPGRYTVRVSKQGFVTTSLQVEVDQGFHTFAYIELPQITLPGNLPLAGFSAMPVSGTIPLMVTFTDQSSNNPTSWRWNFGDGSPESTQQNPSHTYSASGSYTVQLTATNASGSDDEVKTSLVQANPQPSGTVLRQFTGPGTDITGLAWDGTNLWAGDKTADRVFKLDPQNGTQLASFSAPAGNIRGLHFYSGFLYATDLVTKEAYRISTTGTFSTLFNTGVNEPMGLTFNGTNYWVTDDTTDKVFRYNLSGSLINSFASGILSPRAVEVVGSEIRIGGVGDNRIYRLDPTTGTLLGTVQTSPSVGGIMGMTYTGSTLWITDGSTIYETVP